MAEPYVISIPPPNVTGALHIGHALFVSLEDLMIRHARMQGKAALWVPGSDHAGIATQLQVERMLADEGRTRLEVGREEFLERTWAWKERYGGEILGQLRRMGASCDWGRERFTLDDGLSAAVRDVFIALYEEGLIYRGPRLVNWSPGLQTAVSDLEVEHSEEAGRMYHFRYPLKDGGHVPVATTRPETILGDTAVAVHPDDERYRHFVGRVALAPMLGREIPVIADEEVERDKGSGALKVTPGHDPGDFLIGERHGLPVLNVMERDASMNENAGPYAGLDRFECREKMWSDMQAAGLAIKVEDIRHSVPRSQRGGEIIEPLVSVQWFLRMQPLAQRALEAVREGRIRIVPERFEKVYFHWLENIEDWCLSRQLWWGHRIPAWFGPKGEIHVGTQAPVGDGWDAGRGRARYLVQQRAVALQHARLAAGHGRHAALLPHHDDGDRLRHPLLLGGAHDHARPLVHRRRALPHGLSARHGARRPGARSARRSTTPSTRWNTWTASAPTPCASRW